MKILFLVLGFAVLVLGAPDGQISYANSVVIRSFPSKPEQYEALHELENSADLDFWTDIRKGKPVDIMASPQSLDVLIVQLNKFNIPYETFISDVEKIIEEQKLAAENKSKSPKFGWEAYHTIDEIQAFLYELEAEYLSLIKVETIGNSFQGRNMTLVKISTGGSGKRAVFIDGNIHAREWISPAVVTYIVNELVRKAYLNLDVLSMYDFYIVPNVNPDGYAHTHSTARLWRKTRSDHNSTGGCIGADANRNWGYKWGGPGASPDKCSDTFRGVASFSEPENQAIANFILSEPVDWEYFLTFHSYSQYCLTPFADGVLPEDHEEMLAKCEVFASALREVAGTVYSIGNWQDLLYTSSGTSQDWAKAIAGIKYSYTIELRDKGAFGFLLPPAQIQITGEETWAGVKAMLKQ